MAVVSQFEFRQSAINSQSSLCSEAVDRCHSHRCGALNPTLLESSPGDLLPMVRAATLDMVVAARTKTQPDAGLRYRELYEVQMRVVVRTGHPLCGARSLQELTGSEWLSMAAPESAGDLIEQSFLAAGLAAPMPAVHCGSHSVALDLIAASDMIALLPPTLTRSTIAAGRLVELRLRKPMQPLRAGLYMRAGSTVAPAPKAAAQIIVGIARRLSFSGELRSS